MPDSEDANHAGNIKRKSRSRFSQSLGSKTPSRSQLRSVTRARSIGRKSCSRSFSRSSRSRTPLRSRSRSTSRSSLEGENVKIGKSEDGLVDVETIDSKKESKEDLDNSSEYYKKKEQYDNDSDDDEEEAEEEEEKKKNRSRKKKDRYGGFIIDEAEVDDDVEDEDEWEEGAQEIDVIGNEMDELGPTAREIEGRRRGTNLWESKKDEEIEEYLRKKYVDVSTAAHRFGDGSRETNDEITQQSLLPGVKDPSLWMIKCRVGQEKATVLLLLRKVIAYQNSDNPLQIKSVVASEGVKGYIYIEAYKKSHVKAAIENVENLKMGIWKQQIVPINEMTDVLRVFKKHIDLKPKQWVRLKRGIFKDDIAQVDYVDSMQNRVNLKLLPRIDYTRPRGVFRTVQSETIKNKRRPPLKLFNLEAIRAIGGEVARDGDFLIFEGNRYSCKGFLYKNFATDNVIAVGVKPTLSELENFEEAPKSIEIDLNNTQGIETSEGKDQFHFFSNGDNVEVCEGELVNLRGKIISIDGYMITIMPKHEELREALQFQASELRKYFTHGDHVKVIAGRYEGDTGLIVRVEKNRIVLVSDLSIHEVEVLPKNLQLCSDMATGVDSLGKFQWGDLVQLDAQTVGVIFRLERENFHVLSMHGKIVETRPQSLTKRRENRKAMALDCQQNTIQTKDIVKVVDGPHAGREGPIKHLYRSFAFLYSRMFIDYGGIFVCKTRHLQLSGGSKTSFVNGTLSLTGFLSPRITSPMHPSGGERGRGGDNDARRDRALIGTTIKITSGPYKGNVGIVKDVMGTTARVELHSRCHTITVDRSHIANVSSKDGGFGNYSRTPTSVVGQTPMYARDGSKTPMYRAGSQTPISDYGSRTPHYGSITPSHDGSRTPGQSGAWDPTVNNTPVRTNDFDTYNMIEDSSSDYGYPSVGEPFVSQTSGTTYGSEQSFSAYLPSSVDSSIVGSSPAGYAATPSSNNTKFKSHDTFMMSSPVNYYPQIPGSPYNPTPSPSPIHADDDFNSSDWHTTDIEVRIYDSHDDSALAGQQAVIRRISGGICTVYLPTEDREVNLVCEQLEPVIPSRGDRVKVILGENREAVGTLLSIDNQEGVVKFNTDEIKFLQLRFLCKMEAVKIE